MIAIIFYSMNYIANKKLFYCQKKNTRIRKKMSLKTIYLSFIIFLLSCLQLIYYHIIK